MTASAQGIDVSSYQPVLTAADLAGLSFAFAKATEGTTVTDGCFAGNWAAMKAAGVHRGAYHELWPAASGYPVAGQAQRFVSVVRGAGLEAGDMLAVVASDYPCTDADVRGFAGAVKAATGGRNPVIVYTDLDVCRTLTSCTGYDLWIAWPSPAAPASVAPWKTWRLWQWGETGTDRDAYNGTAAEMDAWLAAYAAPPADWVFGPVGSLDVAAVGPHSVRLAWSPPAGAMPLPVARYEVAVTLAGSEKDIPSYPRYVSGALEWEGGSLTPGTAYQAWVRAQAAGSDAHSGPWATAWFTTPPA